MPGTTLNGWQYPLATDTPDVPRDVKALADQIEARLPPRVHAGRATVPVNAAISGTVTGVTFPSTFTNIPRVVATVAGAGSAMWAIATDVVTVNSCAIRVRHIDGTSTTASVLVDWIAVDPS